MGPTAALMRILVWPNNLVTLSRIIVVAGLVAAVACDLPLHPVLGAAIFAGSYFFSDYLDGWLARRLNKCSAFGETLDLLSDRICDVLLAGFLLIHAPAHAPALLAFLLLRIAPEVIIGRFVGAASGMFTTAAQRFVSTAVIARSMDLAAGGRTIFFAWALFGTAPAWAGLLIVVPAALFAVFTLRVLAELAAQSLATQAERR